jgi:predicted tellurium resistance membrane protein TerC
MNAAGAARVLSDGVPGRPRKTRRRLPGRSKSGRFRPAAATGWWMGMDWLADPGVWLSLLTLTALEIVLGIDNIVFIAVLVGKLPREQQQRARRLGIILALVPRLVLLLGIAWVIGLTEPLFTLLGRSFSWRDLILFAGGLFLLYKATHEIHGSLEGEEGAASARVQAKLAAVVMQIALLNLVFSIDSIVTAIGMANLIWVMAAAITLSMIVMLAAAEPVGGFVERHPTVKMLALSFLLLIGTTLIAECFGVHVPKGYIYAAMGFSMFVHLRQPYHAPEGAEGDGHAG